MLIAVFFVLISPLCSQLLHWKPRNQRPEPTSFIRRQWRPPPITHHSRVVFRRQAAQRFPQQRRFPTRTTEGPPIGNQIDGNEVVQQASEPGAMNNEASILAGTMSPQFLRELADYLYDFITGKIQRQHSSRTHFVRESLDSNELLDYEEETRALDAAERAQQQQSRRPASGQASRPTQPAQTPNWQPAPSPRVQPVQAPNWPPAPASMVQPVEAPRSQPVLSSKPRSRLQFGHIHRPPKKRPPGKPPKRMQPKRSRATGRGISRRRANRRRKQRRRFRTAGIS